MEGKSLKAEGMGDRGTGEPRNNFKIFNAKGLKECVEVRHRGVKKKGGEDQVQT